MMAPSKLFYYRLLLAILSPAILLFNLWQAIRAGESRLFQQRLGVSLPLSKESPLWLHAASVGEVIAAQPLIEYYRKEYPLIPFVITTTTPTGAKIAAERLPAEVQHIYLPFDWPGAVQRFLYATKPRAALIMETELWPNLFISIKNNNIPLLIINGRLSTRTLNTNKWIKQLYIHCLTSVTAVLARNKQDAKAYIQLGAAKEKVHIIGNIKFISTASGKTIEPINLGRPYVLAASTHDDEEKQIAEMWLRNKATTHHKLLVIAPRHPKRRNDIVRQLTKLGCEVVVRSSKDEITDYTDIYLVDTLGELEEFMAGADWVFMGGSLVPHGGQNILEPARLGKAIAFGPHMHNFIDETKLLLGNNAAKQVANATELSALITKWNQSSIKLEELGKNASEVMNSQTHVLNHYVMAINKLCKLNAAEKQNKRESP